MTESRIPDIVLERYRLNELPREDAARIDALAGRDASLRARLDALDRSDVEIRQSGALVDRVPRPGPSRARRRSAWLVPAAAIVATVALLVASRNADLIEDRIKGQKPALALYRRTAAGSEALANGSLAHQGDVVRVGYRAAGHAYGVIFSIDGRGTVTMHLPPSGDRAAPLEPRTRVLLDAAYELDDAPLWERFYFVAGDMPFVVAPVVDAIRRSGPLPRGLEQSTFSLQKEVRP